MKFAKVLLVIITLLMFLTGCTKNTNNTVDNNVIETNKTDTNNTSSTEEEDNANFVSIIKKKKLNEELSVEDIVTFAEGAATGSIPDYQLSAMLMAIRLNGMTSDETSALTIAMMNTGEVLDLNLDVISVDKHSTGGVSDGTSLVIAPLVAACGCYVPMVAGRGLGHTGGTIDKLESIEGFKVDLTTDEFVKQVKDIGLAIIAQNADVAPADKKLYALRDVTSTVDSIPLIAASILSKKLASGTDALVLDVKTGNGALMQKLEDSKELAHTMVDICTKAGVDAIAYVTDMNQPLGTYVGNSLEVEYAINVLKGEVKGDYYDLCMKEATIMLIQSGLVKTEEEAQAKLLEVIKNGAALKKFSEMIEAQGGDGSVCYDTSKLPHAPVVKDIYVGQDGYVEAMNTEMLGNIARLLGAGRSSAEDKIDYGVGYIIPIRIGDKVTKDTVLCTVYANSEEEIKAAEEYFHQAITISSSPTQKPNLIYYKITPTEEISYIK